MNIGIFVNSKTGNSLSVAENLRDRLAALGHKVTLERVVASNDSEMDPGKIVLSNPPSIQGYDMLVFAAPVNGARLAFGMQAYLQSLPSLEGKLLAGFVTEAFPFPWMGGNQAIRGMEKVVQAKGGKLSATGVVNWMFAGKRKALIAETIAKIAAISN
ncbi:MAG: flavodoxin family protein [Anaerolineaceae bacterium]|nr:flavodoxin family protein [Anaerolineaceae bacterium]